MLAPTLKLDLPARTNRSPGTSRGWTSVQHSFAPGAVDLPSLAPIMYTFLFRNIASDGFVFSDPQAPGDYSRDSKPGCVIAAPSFPADTPGIDQDYVYNWVRDGAITAMEVAKAAMPPGPGGTVQTLNDYVAFADLCHANAQPPWTPGHACFTIAGDVRPWTEQNDGPALQSVTLLAAHDQLDPATRARAVDLVNANVAFLLGVYEAPTTNLWEEHTGYSFFARSAQLRCFEEVLASTVPGIAKPAGLAAAADWLRQALAGHWDGGKYVSVMADPGDGLAPSPHDPVVSGYDPNIDIVQAAVYGAVPVTDTRLLATAAQLRAQWEEGGIAFYPINKTDREQYGIGPLFGRYPGDVYDGDVAHPVLGGHPWALSTCNVAELHYRLAAAVKSSGEVGVDELSAPFFAQSGIDSSTTPAAAAAALATTGDAMVRAVVHHSDNLELSEQFDGTSGYERSVHNLTWSYAAYLSAMRARAEAV
ncbi:glycoside hydrolase family 15 protein [Saccharothrix sp. S26]|uniref:glycoside hydrolase family 15 protein n=1 Tax=Saccharothrix sp. S26 TaxID=2907215 RepID=UPI001F36D0DC|nr:glycoside hydrolase family 15 protein [Saccharothrix sp. S26]MCE7000706.1 glycoside hydrolase family 15 protein [Saccharothrix sp. S26]